MNKENKKTKNVAVGALLASRGFQETKMTLPCVLGVTDDGKTFLFDLTKMPHVLIGGSTLLEVKKKLYEKYKRKLFI